MKTLPESCDVSFSRSLIDKFEPKPPSLPAPSWQEPMQAQSPPLPKTLFEDLLCGNHLVLWHDMEERPELYEDETAQVVRALTAGETSYDQLGPRERRLLDEATLEYATRPPLRSHERARREIVRAVRQQLTREPQGPLPESELPDFWWLR